MKFSWSFVQIFLEMDPFGIQALNKKLYVGIPYIEVIFLGFSMHGIIVCSSNNMQLKEISHLSLNFEI